MIQQRWFHEKSHEEYANDSQHPRLVPGEVVLQYRQKVAMSVDAMRQAGYFETPEPTWTEWTTTPHVYEKADE